MSAGVFGRASIRIEQSEHQPLSDDFILSPSASHTPMFDAAAGDPSPTSNPSINDLSDAAWNEIAPLLPEPSVLGRRRSTDPRRIVAAISYQWRTGCPWRKLPPEFQPWPTIYGYVAAWRRDGTLRKLRPLLDPKQRVLRRCEEPLPERLNPFREPIRDSLERSYATPSKETLKDSNRQDHKDHKGWNVM